MHTAEQLVSYGTLYLEVGAAVALAFVTWGISRLEPSARGGSWMFRLMVFPGATLLWPVIAMRALRAFRRTP